MTIPLFVLVLFQLAYASKFCRIGAKRACYRGRIYRHIDITVKLIQQLFKYFLFRGFTNWVTLQRRVKADIVHERFSFEVSCNL